MYACTGMRLACFNEPFSDEGHDDVGIVALPISVVVYNAVIASIIRDDCAFIQNGVFIFSERVFHTLTEIAMRVLFPSQ